MRDAEGANAAHALAGSGAAARRGARESARSRRRAGVTRAACGARGMAAPSSRAVAQLGSEALAKAVHIILDARVAGAAAPGADKPNRWVRALVRTAASRSRARLSAQCTPVRHPGAAVPPGDAGPRRQPPGRLAR